MKFLNFALLNILFYAGITNAYADDWCSPQKAPTISVRTSTDQITYDFSKSEKQLNNFNISTVSPYASNVITDVGGLMKGGIETQQRMSFGTITNPNTQQVCIWHDNLDILIHIKPTIYVASEFPQGTCMHNSIMEHEQKHITVDREIVNKYAGLIGQAFHDDIAKYRLFGPVPASQEKATLTMIKQRMNAILTNYTTQMSNERKQRQQAIDNLNEYERVNKSCKK